MLSCQDTGHREEQCLPACVAGAEWTWLFLSHRFSEEGRVHKVAGGSQVRDREIEIVVQRNRTAGDWS